MIDSVTEQEFVLRFDKIGRSENFTPWGRVALFNYLEEYEEETGQQIEFDPIALCCEFSEYESLEELNEAYGKEFEDLEEVRDYTHVIEVEVIGVVEGELSRYNKGFIVQDW